MNNSTLSGASDVDAVQPQSLTVIRSEIFDNAFHALQSARDAVIAALRDDATILTPGERDLLSDLEYRMQRIRVGFLFRDGNLEMVEAECKKERVRRKNSERRMEMRKNRLAA